MHEFTRSGNIDFNSHAHVERDYTTGAGTAIVFNFNSHAHVERDSTGVDFNGIYGISTHTLTWSVTREWGFKHMKLNISTHTLTWSVTKWQSANGIFVQFQLTRSRGA